MNVIKVISELFCFKNTGYKSSTVSTAEIYNTLYSTDCFSDLQDQDVNRD